MKSLPDTVGPYKIVKKLGEGGFATVYLAYPQDRDDSQCVALKVLKSRENYGRFQREIQTAARLIHPNIVRIYDTGEDEETRTPFFSMEYVSGGTLFERLEAEHRLPREEAVEIIRHIGSALIYPHQQDIIHCDVNPKNILLDPRYNPVRPALTDFGLVKPLGMEGSELTDTIALVGTFAYYAPEQWNKEEVGPETDVYALAITFFEMVSGRRPFEGDVFSLREKHLYQPLPRLSDFVPEIGPFFDEVLQKATAKEPLERYENVARFIEALDAANEQARQDEWVMRRGRASETTAEVTHQVERDQLEPHQVLELIKRDLEALAFREKAAKNQEHELRATNHEDDDNRISLLMLGGLFVTIGNELIKEATQASNPDIAQLQQKYNLTRYHHILKRVSPDHPHEPRPNKPEKRSLVRQFH
jgi:serine/threonine-protein kinase